MILLSTFATIPWEDRGDQLWKFKLKEGNCGENNLKGFYCSTHCVRKTHSWLSAWAWVQQAKGRFLHHWTDPVQPTRAGAGAAMSWQRHDGETSPWQRVRRRRTGHRFFSQIRPAWRHMRNSASCTQHFRQRPTSLLSQPAQTGFKHGQDSQACPTMQASP